MIIPTSNSTLFISFVYSDEIELSNSISGSIYLNPLLANSQTSVTFFKAPRPQIHLRVLNEKFVPSLYFTLFENVQVHKSRPEKSLSVTNGMWG